MIEAWHLIAKLPVGLVLRVLLHLNQSHHRLSLSLSRTHSLAIMIETFISNKKATSYARFNLFFRHPTGFDAIVGFLLKVYGCSVRVLRKIKLGGGAR